MPIVNNTKCIEKAVTDAFCLTKSEEPDREQGATQHLTIHIMNKLSAYIKNILMRLCFVKSNKCSLKTSNQGPEK